jgi:hypothetical protein
MKRKLHFGSGILQRQNYEARKQGFVAAINNFAINNNIPDFHFQFLIENIESMVQDMMAWDDYYSGNFDMRAQTSAMNAIIEYYYNNLIKLISNNCNPGDYDIEPGTPDVIFGLNNNQQYENNNENYKMTLFGPLKKPPLNNKSSGVQIVGYDNYGRPIVYKNPYNNIQQYNEAPVTYDKLKPEYGKNINRKDFLIGDNEFNTDVFLKEEENNEMIEKDIIEEATEEVIEEEQIEEVKKTSSIDYGLVAELTSPLDNNFNNVISNKVNFNKFIKARNFIERPIINTENIIIDHGGSDKIDIILCSEEGIFFPHILEFEVKIKTVITVDELKNMIQDIKFIIESFISEKFGEDLGYFCKIDYKTVVVDEDTNVVYSNLIKKDIQKYLDYHIPSLGEIIINKNDDVNTLIEELEKYLDVVVYNNLKAIAENLMSSSKINKEITGIDKYKFISYNNSVDSTLVEFLYNLNEDKNADSPEEKEKFKDAIADNCLYDINEYIKNYEGVIVNNIAVLSNITCSELTGRSRYTKLKRFKIDINNMDYKFYSYGSIHIDKLIIGLILNYYFETINNNLFFMCNEKYDKVFNVFLNEKKDVEFIEQ